MHFIIGSIKGSVAEWWSAEGAVALVYDSIFGAIVTYLIFAIFALLAIIGLKTVIQTLLFGKKKTK